MSKILVGDCLSLMKSISSSSVDSVITSPPYFGLRDYGHAGQIGLESTPEEYISKIVEVMREVKRVLKTEGTLWLNIGDSYATGTKAERQQSKNPGVGSNRPEAQNSVRRIGTPEGLKTKDLIGIPWRLAFALQADGWYLRQDIVWHKPNAMPESVTDRCTKSHEYVFLLTKSQRYYFDNSAVKEPYADNNEGKLRNRRTVWSVNTEPFKGAHFATFPRKLAELCVLAGSPKGGLVLDPFAGAGTVGLVCEQLGRQSVLLELNPDYAKIASDRISDSGTPTT